jgi:hypothetical protein
MTPTWIIVNEADKAKEWICWTGYAWSDDFTFARRYQTREEALDIMRRLQANDRTGQTFKLEVKL